MARFIRTSPGYTGSKGLGIEGWKWPRAAAKGDYSHVTKDRGVCGGRACIDGTRIRVMDIAGLRVRPWSSRCCAGY